MSDYGMTQDFLGEKGRLEREYANDIAALTVALEKEHELRFSLEEKLEYLDESQNAFFSQIIKERDYAIAKYKLYKKEKVEFGVGHDRLTEELEKLTKAHKALESEHSILTKSFEQLQIQSSKTNVPSSSTTSRDTSTERHIGYPSMETAGVRRRRIEPSARKKPPARAILP